MVYDPRRLPITFSNEPMSIDQFTPPDDFLAQARQRAIGASTRGSASGEREMYRPPVKIGIDPIVPSAAAQYMAAQERARRALAESTRMQQGQIPQALSRTAQQGQAQIGRPMGVTAPQAEVAEDGYVKQDGSFLSQLYADPSSARGKALQAAASTALQLSGYQNKPVTTGEVLGAMMQSGMGAYEKATAREEAKQLAAQQRTTDLQLKLMEIEAARQKTGRDANKQIFEQEKNLRGEFTTASKPFKEMMENFSKSFALATKKNPTGASDIALVFTFMKTLDPRSVVRENEQASAENAGGVPAAIRNFYNKLYTGQRFDPVVREEILGAAKTLVFGQLEAQMNLENRYDNLASSYDLDADNIYTSLLPKSGTFLSPTKVSSVEEAEKLPKGTYFDLNGRMGINE